MASSFSTRLWGWTALVLLLAPRLVRAAPPTVDVNGTSIVGTSQTFADVVSVEFFGGQFSGTHATGFVARESDH